MYHQFMPAYNGKSHSLQPQLTLGEALTWLLTLASTNARFLTGEAIVNPLQALQAPDSR
jgi:hypothetical protein